MFANATEGDFLKIGGIARFACGGESLPCRRVHFAALVVRQAPRVGADLIAVAGFIAISRVRRMGIVSLLAAQAVRTSKARRFIAVSSGRGFGGGVCAAGFADWAAAGEIARTGGEAASVAPTAMPAPPSSVRRASAVAGRPGVAWSGSVEMMG